MAINPAHDHKWPIPLDSLLTGSVSPTYQNLSPIAHHTSPGRAIKDGRLEEILYIENALMQQPSHISIIYISTYLHTGHLPYAPARAHRRLAAAGHIVSLN